jgi:hypothetical protein
MSDGYYILKSDGSRDGPWAEEELLDLLENGQVKPDENCLHAASGRICPAGEMFHVISPEPPGPPQTAPVAWEPAPFPAGSEAGAPTAEKPRVRLHYRGSPSVLTYGGRLLLAAALIAGGCLFRREVPSMLAIGLIAGSAVLLAAVLRRMSTQYSVTSARVESVRGLLSRSSRELRIADIRAINVTCSGLMGLLGIGSVTFSSEGGSRDDVIFDRVWNANGLKNLVRRLQDSA